MSPARKILAMGGHDFDRQPGNQALCDKIVELSGSSQPRICLLPTASGDPHEQIGRFRRAFAGVVETSAGLDGGASWGF